MLFTSFLASQINDNKQGPIICNLCIDACEKLKGIAQTKGIKAARNCQNVNGFLGSICSEIVDFGMNKILK